uniref:Methionine sulfoxide reductase B1 n=1 Tax=Stegastes partitus TaxID=144197 RepID=A0A3B4ZY39_9TELE
MSYCCFSGGEEYKNHFQPGVYVCSECGHQLFSSSSKFEHSSPWPAFSETLHKDSVSRQPEAWGPIKICCGKCGNGLGHEFFSSLKFIPKGGNVEETGGSPG